MKPHIQKMAAYHPPLDGRETFMLLDFNERTVPIPDEIQKKIEGVWSKMLKRVHVYPAYGNIVERIARYAGVAPDHLMITNGSDQGIDLLIRGLCETGDSIVIPMPSFAMYGQSALVENLRILAPPYHRENGFPWQEVEKFCAQGAKLAIIPNPNSPTGTGVDPKRVVELAAQFPQTGFLVDECYYDYTHLTVKDEVGRLPNLYVTRTFSKTWGLPSLRLGFLMAHPDRIADLCKVRGPYDMNQAAVEAVRVVLDHPDYVQAYAREVLTQAKPELESFLKKQGLPYWPSQANFFYLNGTIDTRRIVDELKEKHQILVRPQKPFNGQPAMRMTVGTVEQTRRLIDALTQILQ